MKRQSVSIAMAAILYLLASCAGSQAPVTLGPGGGEKTLLMKASDFKFEPNNIKVGRGDTIVFKIDNTSDTAHNFTVKDPLDKMLLSVDLPPKQTTVVKAVLSENGKYTFYCNKPLHSTMGMKGKIEVGP